MNEILFQKFKDDLCQLCEEYEIELVAQDYCIHVEDLTKGADALEFAGLINKIKERE